MLFFLVLGLIGYAGCSVEEAGLVTSTGGLADAGSGGAGGWGMGGGPRFDAISGTGGLVGEGGVATTGGAPGLGGTAATGGMAGAGGVSGTGGSLAIDGSSETGEGPGTGGTSGAGGATAVDSLLLPDGPSDTLNDVTPDAEPDVAMDHGDLDSGGPDLAPDMRDARHARDATDVSPGEPGPTLPLVWWDEFNAAANTGIDTNNWNYVTWPPGQVNDERQQYTSSLANVFHDGNGHLVLRGRYSPPGNYTSGRIDTQNKVAFGPGHRIEVRARLPAGTGSFPAIVMMGTSGLWPACGQLSIMEQYGQDKSWFYSTVRAGSAPGSGSTDHAQYSFADAATASEDFHVYSVDWYSDHVVFQVDGDEILTSVYTAESPLHNIAEYIILDVALGGDMGGAIDNSAFPMDMVVDYVRVYEL
jgi:beta-glucanase (GH16 family)